MYHLNDCNGIRTHKHLIRERTLKHFDENLNHLSELSTI